MSNDGTGLTIQNQDGTRPAVQISNAPATAKGLPALAVAQGDSTGAAIYTNSAGTLLDLRNAAGVQQLKVDNSGNVTAAGTLPDGSPFTAADAGLLAWNYDVGLSSNSTAPTTNVVNLVRINIRQAISVTNVLIGVTTAGGTLTSGQNFVGLYNSAGTLIGTSADQTTAWGTTGLKTAALTGGPFALAAGTFVWAAIVSNTGATTPALFRTASLNAAGMNAGFAAATARWATNGTATTALAGTITPASNVVAGVGYWAGVS